MVLTWDVLVFTAYRSVSAGFGIGRYRRMTTSGGRRQTSFLRWTAGRDDAVVKKLQSCEVSKNEPRSR